MSVYVVGQIRIKDQVVWEEYKSQVGDTLKPYGGCILFRGEVADSFVGVCEYPEIVAIEFDSINQAKAWYWGEEYQKIAPLRKQSADVILYMYK
ncbi:MAG: DUF1330 domain-containing protein [Campylobacterales bacterium]|nr:DUF1330 domain-containing protein [Campylobacterales bacterium]